MKRLVGVLLTLAVIGVLCFPGLGFSADAPSTKGKWGVGVRGGLHVYTTDDLDEEGDVGPSVGGTISYGVTDWLTLGFNTEWEKHDVDLFGDFHSVSFLPYLEARGSLGPLAPYFSLGAGYALNWVDEDNQLKEGCRILFGSGCQVDIDNSFVLKVGGGADYFITQAFAFNTELAWKYNDPEADLDLNAGGTLVSDSDTDLSGFSALFGFRYYF